MADMQWYQSNTFVTVSLKLCSVDNRSVTANFTDRQCTVYTAGIPVWSCHLAYPIVPEKCKIRPAGKRIELKLKKCSPELWNELEDFKKKRELEEAKKHIENVKTSGRGEMLSEKKEEQVSVDVNKECDGETVSFAVGGKQDNVAMETEELVQEVEDTVEVESMDTEEDDLFHTPLTTSPAPLSPPSFDQEKRFGSTKEPMKLKHLSHDMMEKDAGRIVLVKIMVTQINPHNCIITFNKYSLEIQFSTADNRFLSSYPDSTPDTTFVWNIKLYDGIVPDKSVYNVKDNYIELLLTKTQPRVRWKCLEGLQSHSHSLQTRPTNQMHETQLTTPTFVSANQISDDNVNDRGLDRSTSLGNSDSMMDSQTPLNTSSVKNVQEMESEVVMATNSCYDNGLEDDPVSDNRVGAISNGGAMAYQPTNNYSPFKSEFNPFMLPTIQSRLSRQPKSPVDSKTGSDDVIYDDVIHDDVMNDDVISGNDLPLQNGHTCIHDDCEIGIEKTEEQETSGDRTGCTGLGGDTSCDQVGLIPTKSPLPLNEMKPFFRLSSDLFRAPSLTGIANMGNTCFMSSVLQSLSNTIEVRDFFLGDRYMKEINITNPLGCQGKLAECFNSVIKKLWSGEIQYFTPKKFKSLVASKSDRFSGYSQQDAHEFTTFLLDGLHEDLNRVKNKPITQQVECKGKSDIEVADESWLSYKKRNDSFIVDLFGGQFKSTLVCPVCSKVSVTFDPFMSLSVPLPKKVRTLPVIFVRKNPEYEPKELILKLPPEGTLELLKASVARKTSIPMTELRVFEAYRGKFQTMMSNNQQPISKIGDNDIIIVSEVLSRREAKERVVELNVILRLQYPLCPTACSRKECGRKGVELKRCGRCKYVAYCNKECQQCDWSKHKMKCEISKSFPIALPFVISLPASQVTYDGIAEQAEMFARWYIDYHRPVPTIPVAKQSPSQPSIDIVNDLESVNTQSVISRPGPMYHLIPVNVFRDTIPGEGPLQSKGNEPLLLPSKFLAMEWRNNPKDIDHVEITLKDHMLYRKAVRTDSSEISNKDIKLEECLQLFTEPELLPKDNAWYCPQCKEHREATKQMSVWRLPHVLIIHLKRFSFHNFIWRDKIDKLVKIPLRGLDMTPYILGEAANQITPDTAPIYDLYATVNHYGNVYLGHYTASIKSPVGDSTEWLFYDDQSVIKILQKNVVTKDCYVLFYRRRDI